MRSVVIALLCVFPVAVADTEIGYLKVKGSLNNVFIVTIAEFSASIPTSDNSQYTITIASPYHGCEPLSNNVKNSLVMVERGNCSFVTKAHYVIASGGAGIIVVNSEDSVEVMGGNVNLLWPEDELIASVMISNKDATDILKHSDNGLVGTIFSASRGFEALIALWIMAVGTVYVGSVWASPSSVTAVPRHSRMAEQQPLAESDHPVEITIATAVGFILFASLSLMILFFFMNLLIYFVIVMFCIGSSSALYQCITAFIVRFTTLRRSGVFNISFRIPFVGMCDILSILIAIGCLSIAVLFFVFRNSADAWILQDTLGIALCLLFLRTFRFPNARTSALLLVLAFVYDIFWVFVSPLLFEGKSVMVTVATGGDSGESIPMLLRFPNSCLGCSPALLGLGDIVLPGLFVSFTLAFDIQKGRSLRDGYFLYNLIGYGVGLICTYVALFAMQKGQPALLYLVPCTLGLTFVVALFRGEWSDMWDGPHVVASPETERDSEQSNENYV